MKYEEFIESKGQYGEEHGFDPVFMPKGLMDFQEHMIGLSVRKGRFALLEDCGMGKTVQYLGWAQNVVQKTAKPVLILTPLAVSPQVVREGEKFQIECHRAASTRPGDILVTNYEKLDKFSPYDYSGVVLDESSILKNFSGARRAQITEFMRHVPYRLLATATAAPNDYVELGTSSEALGYLGHMDMLARFFKNDQNNIATKRMYGEAPKWSFKGHSEQAFWRWVCSWARAMRRPSDLGYDDGPFVLPALIETRHIVEATTLADGQLFPLPAVSMPDQREEKRRTITERCEKAAEILSHGRPSIAWCHMNEEARILRDLMPDAVEISGSDSDESKEEKFLAFIDGQAKRLITKPKIGALGLNFQHCHDMTAFVSHSYEQYYQLVRRCWRFGQKHEVNVDLVMTEGEIKVMDNLARKAKQAETMFSNLVAEMNNAMGIERKREFTKQTEIPAWL